MNWAYLAIIVINAVISLIVVLLINRRDHEYYEKKIEELHLRIDVATGLAVPPVGYMASRKAIDIQKIENLDNR